MLDVYFSIRYMYPFRESNPIVGHAQAVNLTIDEHVIMKLEKLIVFLPTEMSLSSPFRQGYHPHHPYGRYLRHAYDE